MDNIKFNQWIKKQKDRNDPIGDLSRDFLSTGHKDPSDWPKYLHKNSACDGAFKALYRAIKEFNQQTEVA